MHCLLPRREPQRARRRGQRRRALLGAAIRPPCAEPRRCSVTLGMSIRSLPIMIGQPRTAGYRPPVGSGGRSVIPRSGEPAVVRLGPAPFRGGPEPATGGPTATWSARPSWSHRGTWAAPSRWSPTARYGRRQLADHPHQVALARNFAAIDLLLDETRRPSRPARTALARHTAPSAAAAVRRRTPTPRRADGVPALHRAPPGAGIRQPSHCRAADLPSTAMRARATDSRAGFWARALHGSLTGSGVPGQASPTVVVASVP
jgi:hypothetical protein